MIKANSMHEFVTWYCWRLMFHFKGTILSAGLADVSLANLEVSFWLILVNFGPKRAQRNACISWTNHCMDVETYFVALWWGQNQRPSAKTKVQQNKFLHPSLMYTSANSCCRSVWNSATWAVQPRESCYIPNRLATRSSGGYTKLCSTLTRSISLTCILRQIPSRKIHL